MLNLRVFNSKNGSNLAPHQMVSSYLININIPTQADIHLNSCKRDRLAIPATRRATLEYLQASQLIQALRLHHRSATPI